MKPGLSRGLTAAILGFLGSMGFVMLLRGLQGVEPLFDPQLGMVLGAFVSSFAFVWGMGGSNPRMSQHPHEPEVDAETGLIVADVDEETLDEDAEIEEEARIAGPLSVMGFSMWQISAWTIGMIVVVFGFATLPTGLYLRSSADPEASTNEIGYYTFEMPFGGPEVEMSQLTTFVLVVLFVLFSLMVIGTGLALLFTSLSRNVVEVKSEDPVRLSYDKPDAVPRKPWRRDLIIALGILLVYVSWFPFMEKGMSLTQTHNLLLIALAAGLGIFLTSSNVKDTMDAVDQRIEAVKFNSMTAGLVFLFPILYLLHYEVLVGFIFATPWLRVLLSLGGAVALTLGLTFLLFSDTVSGLVIGSARDLRRRLAQVDGAPGTTDAPALAAAGDAPQLDASNEIAQTTEAAE